MYSFDDVLQASEKYFNGDELAANVFVTKYALCNKGGDYHELTPDEMHKRMASEFLELNLTILTRWERKRFMIFLRILNM